MKRKYFSEAERKAVRRIQNQEAQQRSRAKAKLKPKVQNITTGFVIPNNNYNDNYFSYCSTYPFSHLITFTNSDFVTLNMHDKAIMKVINHLVDNCIISNYLKTHEYAGGNYHSHLLIQVNKWGINLRKEIELKWQNGFYRIDILKNDLHRLNAIRYCLKEVDTTSNTHLNQSIADTMTVDLSQSFESLKKADSERLHDFKVKNGLYPLFKK